MTEIVFFPSAGSYPGFPGTHGPGLYEVNFEARTITPVPDISTIVDSTIEPVAPLAVSEPAQEPLQGSEQEPDPNATQPLEEPTEPVVEGQEQSPAWQ
jgi:hypothetical protein